MIDIKIFEKNLKKDNIEIPEIIISENDNEIFIKTANKYKSNTYCPKCGLELVGKPNGYYSSSTGKESMSLYCPSLLCDHAYINHDYTKSGLFHKTCTKCNNKIPGDLFGVVCLILLAAAIVGISAIVIFYM